MLLNDQEREGLISAWIVSAEAEFDSQPHKENRWADRKLDELMVGPEWDGSAENADEAWEIIQAINQRPLSNKAFALLAAGPLENLLSRHGELFIKRVEELAGRDPHFNHLLGGVWQNAMSDTVWERVQAARDEVW